MGDVTLCGNVGDMTPCDEVGGADGMTVGTADSVEYRDWGDDGMLLCGLRGFGGNGMGHKWRWSMGRDCNT